jgi:8-oxo-dGTP pyrophosphatase MutT (NUDIX family)
MTAAADATDGSRRDVVEAGGIVRRHIDGELRVAVVHRKRYDGDWTLPKGHVNADETLLHAAVREVREEAVCIGEPAELAGVITYQTTEGTKYVVFWWMDYTGDVDGPSDPEEVASVHWLRPAVACQRLTYPQQRRLLEPLVGSHRVGRRSWFERLVPAHPTRGNLRVAIERARIEQLGKGVYPDDEPDWLVAAERCLDAAESHLRAEEYDDGWALLHRAHEFEVQAFSRERCDAEASDVRLEASSKLTGWRRGAVLELLAVESWSKASDDMRKVRLADALRIRHESFANEYRDVAILRRYQAILVLMATPVLAVLAAGFIVFVDQLGPSAPLQRWWVAAGTILLGALGGITSALQRVTRQGPRTRVPLRLSALVGSLSRPVIGAIAGLTVYLGALAGLLVPNDNPVPFALLAAFGSGFTERLVVRRGDDTDQAASAGPSS